jgi:hypothetical protein
MLVVCIPGKKERHLIYWNNKNANNWDVEIS